MTASAQTLMPAGVLGERQLCPSSGHASKSNANVLPFGTTLHYAGCGCPAWQKGSRVADQVDALVNRSHQLFENNLISPNRPLRVCYMLPHHNITGGMKCLVEHIRLLRERGHYTIAAHRSDTAKRAMPPWTAVEADADVVCNLHQRLSDVYPIQDIDVVVVGIFHQVAELLAGVHAPVLYWEQGHEWIFGDPVRLQVAQNYLKQDQLFHLVMHLPCVLAAVSSAVQDILQQEFGRTSLLIPNGIDCARFTPGPWQPAGAATAATVVEEDAAAAPPIGNGVSDCPAGSNGAAGAAEAQTQQQQKVAAAAATAGNSAEAMAAVGADDVVTGSGEAAGTAVAQTTAAAAAVLPAAAPAGEVDVTGEQQFGAMASGMENGALEKAACVDVPLAGLGQLQEQQLLDSAGASCADPPPVVMEESAATALDDNTAVDGNSVSQAPEAAVAAASPDLDGKHRILIVGNPALPLKGFPTAIAALAAVAAMLPIRVRWVCQVLPTAMTVPNLPLVDFELETVVSPSQTELPALYRGHDVFLFTSRYEAWGMPVLEAMASGVPVVTTDCLGVRTFCRHGENCLVAAPDDASGVAQHLLTVLTDSALRAKLSAAGRETALQYTPDKVMEHLEAILYCLTACGPELLQLRQNCVADLHIACAKASEACSRNSTAAQQQQQQQQQLLMLRAQLKQQLQRQAAAEQQHQRLQALLKQQQQLQLGLQPVPHQQQQQQQGQHIRLQSLQVLQQLNLVNPQQHISLLRQQQQQAPLQASLLVPFLQTHQPLLQQQSLQPTLQLQVRSSGALQQQQQQQGDYSSMSAAVADELLKCTSQQQQQHMEQRSEFSNPFLQQTSSAAVQQQSALHFASAPAQQQQQQNAAALQVLQLLQQQNKQQQQQQQQHHHQQQQHAALLSMLQGGSSGLGQLPSSSQVLRQQLAPGSLFLQQQQQVPTSLFQQQQQQQVPMSLFQQQQQQQQQQQVPTSLFQQQQHQLQQVPMSLFQQQPLQQLQQVPTSVFQQQQQQLSSSLWQQQQQVPTSFLLQQQQQHVQLVTGLLDGTSAAAAGQGPPLQLLPHQQLVQGLPASLSQQQQQQQHSAQLPFSHQMP